MFASNYPPIKVSVDPNLIHYKEVTLTGSENRTERDFLKAVNMINSRSIDLRPLISEIVGFYEVEEGFEKALQPSSYRVMVKIR